MTDVKQLPENLKELEQKTLFKQTYKKHTVDEFQEMLVEIDTDYLSEDNKAALVWRYMDAKGMPFDETDASGNDEAESAKNEESDTPAAANETETETKQDETIVDATPQGDTEQPKTVEAPTLAQHLAMKSKAAAAVSSAPAPAVEVKDYVEIRNMGSFGFLETATNTLVRAKEVAKIHPTARVTKEQILANIKQYNHTRGNLLKIIK